MASSVKIVLLAMVKNEEKNIKRLFSSVQPWIDGIVLCDTGSTDGTVQLSKSLIEEMKMPGRIYQYPWENFGKSRSKSFQCFRDWVHRSSGWDATKVFALTLDADMVLTEEGGLHDKLGNLGPEFGGATLLQENGSIIYSNVRLLRASDEWKSTGPTHEYWECNNGKRTEQFSSPTIRDIGDGGSKADKFTRDAKMLEDDLKENPNNVRTYFYLGQTYMSLGDPAKSIDYLTKRIQMGGWDEEIYIAHIYKGDSYKTLNKPLEAVREWLEAYQRRPHRSEALTRLITHYRMLPNMHHVAYMYIEKLVQLQTGRTLEGQLLWKPVENHDSLFVSHLDMKYTVWEELGIVAYYCDKGEAARASLDRISISAGLDFYQRNRLLDLYQWYRWNLPTTKSVRLEIPEKDLAWLSEGFWKSYNPSIQKAGDRYVINLRTANYETKDANYFSFRAHEGKIITRNIIADFDSSFKILYDKNPPTEISIPSQYVINKTTEIEGVEDCRWLGKTSFIGTTRQFSSTDMNRMIRLDLNPNTRSIIRFTPLVAPIASEDKDCQKNWLPFVSGGQEYFVYRINPFTVCKINNEKVVEWKPSGGITFDGFRGSAAPVPWSSAANPKEAWLLIIHFSHYGGGSNSGGGRKYYHRFLTLDGGFIPSRLSTIFVSGDAAVQYISGLSESLNPGRYVITMGINDSDARALETEAATIEGALIYGL